MSYFTRQIRRSWRFRSNNDGLQQVFQESPTTFFDALGSLESSEYWAAGGIVRATIVTYGSGAACQRQNVIVYGRQGVSTVAVAKGPSTEPGSESLSFVETVAGAAPFLSISTGSALPYFSIAVQCWFNVPYVVDVDIDLLLVGGVQST